MLNTGAASRFLDLRALAALAHMRFVTRRRIDGAFSGRHQSRQQGGAGEFVDYREYSHGEDLRRLDWKALARTERAYIKLYQDETNLRCTLALDTSRSMLFGQAAANSTAGSKLEYAQYLATALSHVIGLAQDQVGLAVLGSRLQELLPPGSTGTHLSGIYSHIAALQAQPTLTLAPALQDLFARGGRRGVLLLMSDFLVDDLEEAFAALRLFRHRQWEVIVLHLVHPDEERLPDGGAFRFEGLENEGQVACTPAEIRASYQELFARHLAMVRTLSLSGGCDYRRVSTQTSYLKTLGGFLVERSG
ncbi:MAG: DUF58 domain-containing protein [Pirellulales bacterium]